MDEQIDSAGVPEHLDPAGRQARRRTATLSGTARLCQQASIEVHTTRRG